MLKMMMVIVLRTQNQQKTIKNYQNYLAKIWKIGILELIEKQNENKDTTNEYRYFFESKLVVVSKLFLLINLNRDNNWKRFKTRIYYFQGTIKSCNVIINGNDLYDQFIDADIKRFAETGKLTTCQGEDYTAWSLLSYKHIKISYKVIAVDLSLKKEIDADSKAIQKIQFVRRLKNTNGINAGSDNAESMFSLTILGKIKKTRTRFSQGSVMLLLKVPHYEQTRVELKNN